MSAQRKIPHIKAEPVGTAFEPASAIVHSATAAELFELEASIRAAKKGAPGSEKPEPSKAG